VGIVGGLNTTGTVAPTDGNGWPGDPTGAIGPNHYVEYNNDIIAVLDRGTLK
jgi:hypothetical protein